VFIFNFIKNLLVLAVIGWCLGFAYFIGLVPRKQTDTGGIVTDAVIVLTGGKKRIEEGFSILRSNKSKKLFITGVSNLVSNEEVINAHGGFGAYGHRVEFGREAKTTYGNALETQKWIAKNNIRTITLVTANYHMPRSMVVFGDVLPSDITIIEHPVFPDNFYIKDFWFHLNSIKILLLEYNRTLLFLYEQKVQDRS